MRNNTEHLLAVELTLKNEQHTSKNCSELHFRHSAPIQRTLLTSFPGSGNVSIR